MTKRAQLDPATRYATDVVARRIVAARLVILACQRHLNDLRDAERKGLIWKPLEAQEAIDFFATCLTLPEETDTDEDEEVDADVTPEAGTPFVLTNFQAFIVGSLFGWFAIHVSKKTGALRERQRFRIAFFQGGKGCGKTPLGAGILIFMLVRRGVRGAQLFCAGAMKEQALIPFADCLKMVHASPDLTALITETGNNLAVKETGSFIRPISSDSRSQSGKRVQGAVIEELHEHPNRGLVGKMRAGIKGRPNALLFLPTNTGFNRESVCFEYYDHSCQILEGTLVNESWFAFVCHLDACDRCHAAGKRQPSDDCPDCDDWKVEGPHWLKANPNLGVSIPWQYLRDEVQVAVAMPSERNTVRRLNFCQWTQQVDVWIPLEQWAACAGPVSSASLVGRECYVGIDLSDKIDLSSVVLVFPRPIEREVPRPDDAPALDRAIDVLPYFWMPHNTLVRRSQEDNVPYVEWEKAGHITSTPGDIIDHDAIVDFIISQVSKQYRVRHIGFDQAGATAAVTRLRRHFGDDLVTEIPQSFRHLSEPSKTVEALIVSRNVAHTGNPVMHMCMGNMAKEENHWREIRPIKIGQRKRIDGGVALVDGVAAMLVTAFEPSSVYMTRGVRSLGD